MRPLIVFTATILAALFGAVAQSNAEGDRVPPFTAEEDGDGARAVWFFINLSGHPRPYERCRDIPNSIYYVELKDAALQAGDVFWWPDFMALYDPNEKGDNDLIAFGRQLSSRDLEKKYGPPRYFRVDVDKSVKPDEIVVDAFGRRCVCKNPDPTLWLEELRKTDKEKGKGMVLLKRIPLEEKRHGFVVPVISVQFQVFPDEPPSLKEYAGRVVDSGENVSLDSIEEVPEGLLCRLHYTEGTVRHKVVMLCHIVESVGIRLMADSTEDSYPQVDRDFETFVRSLTISPKR